ncbi:protein kinase C [Lachancea thermotolerans CBS 6340]|uniref:Protein kinase C-like 1 n=1 Tax=Lachancea thermotolerans (strain ATCC 56472 / CBS 6340 / NRRL Y-8284) TaxID=559295 RepID=C5DE14_LACTC|nr:KLTH0C05478p [Lachancea thermotolerans CBS 6340]CAR22025.1 KLTH0C05478p [Lachancea thermotolerans CBS 6340]
MLTQVEQEIRRKIERELNIIQGASQLKKKTDNVMVIQKCNTNIREAQQNIQYLEETLKKLQISSDQVERNPSQQRASQVYGQLSTIAPDEHSFSRLDLMKYDCPSLSQRIQYMLQQLEFKLQVEQQYQEANEKLTKLYQIDGDQRSSSAAEGGSRESKQRINLLKKSLKKYQAINVDLDQFRHQGESSHATQPKFRRKQLTGVLSIGVTAIRDVDHVQSPLFSRKPDTFITIKIDDTVKAKTKPSRNGRWHESFNINVGKGNEVELTVYDRVNDQTVPVAQMWLLLSDIAEEIRKKKAEQSAPIDWNPAAGVTSSSEHSTKQANAGAENADRRLGATSEDIASPSQEAALSQPVTTSLWFVLEPAGQILLNLGFSKSSAPTDKHLIGGLHRHGAIINRKEEVYEQHGHHFVQKSFYNIMCCAYCGDFLRYSGFQCQDCKFLCHKKCYNHVVTKCIAKSSSDTDPDEAKLNHRIPHRFEPISNRGTKWCCHCGYILPWGKKNLRKCSECGIMCHVQCAHLVPDFCGMSMGMANKILTAIQDTKRSQEQRQKLQVSPPKHQYPGAELSKKTSRVSERSFETKQLPVSPTQKNLSDVRLGRIDVAAEDQRSDKQRFTETAQKTKIKPTASETERNGVINERLNNFIEENADYEAFTQGAGSLQLQDLDTKTRSLDPSLASGLASDKPDLSTQENDLSRDNETSILLEQQRDAQLERARDHQGFTEFDDSYDDAMVPLETKRSSFNNTMSTQVDPGAQLPQKWQITPEPEEIPQKTEEHTTKAYKEQRHQDLSDAKLVQITPQQSADALTKSQQSSPEAPQTGGRHKRKAPKRRKISLDDFVLLKVLGKGNFGKVLLAESKNNERLCAIKVLKKDHIIKNHDIESARAEKKVFLLATKAKHPFLTNLYCSFQTENRIYFAMEFIGGGDLMWHVQNQRLSVRRAKFYAAEVLLALKYFHDNGVIYRDLKLENILLTPEGHIKIADYGLCKDEMWFGNKTSTFCGTPEFMAPEILKEQEYTKAVDWWAFGVLLYQMLLCQSPFSGDDEDEVFNAILTDEPLYPIDMAGDIVQIFQGLLTKDPERRLGAGPRDAAEVMAEPFFRNINFDDILHKRVQPPYIPEIKAADDTSYFEKEFTSAPPTLTPLPSVLSSSLQEEFRGFSFMPDDLLL